MPLESSAAQVSEYADGDVIFEEGTPGEQLFIVMDGCVRIRKRGQVVATVLTEFGPGEIFGEIALVEARPHSADALAIGPTRLATYDREAFLEALREDPELALRVIASMSDRLRDTTDKLQAIATQHVLDRAEMVLVQKAVLESDLI